MRELLAAVQEGIDRGWHSGAQVYVSIGGQAVADAGFGASRPGVPMRVDTIGEWGSATKPITCSALCQLWQRGLLDLDDRVCDHIPEFGANGKTEVRVRHLLTHTAGIADAVFDVKPWGEAVAEVCAAPLIEGWVPGTRARYNSVAMWAVAEIVARLTGRTFRDFVCEEIFTPLDMSGSSIGMSPETFHRLGDRVAVIPEVPESGTEAWVAWGRPTGGGHGPIRDLARFYEAFLAGRVVSAPVREAMTSRHVCGMGEDGLGFDVGLGFTLSRADKPMFGRYASRRAFGHGGRSWCVAFADPEHDLVVGLYWNGAPGWTIHTERLETAMSAVYADLALAGSPRG